MATQHHIKDIIKRHHANNSKLAHFDKTPNSTSLFSADESALAKPSPQIPVSPAHPLDKVHVPSLTDPDDLVQGILLQSPPLVPRPARLIELPARLALDDGQNLVAHLGQNGRAIPTSPTGHNSIYDRLNTLGQYCLS
jgi:hypothetical protein